MELFETAVAQAVAAALAEDAAERDVTTRLLVPPGQSGKAVVIARSGGVISGQECAAAVYRHLGGAEWTVAAPDGAAVTGGEVVGRVAGRLGALLAGERTALNFLARLSGIATLTAAFVARVAGTGARILDTRKTTPGLRRLEKRAVVDGGGTNHRFDLASCVLVKENHIAAAGGLEAVTARLGPRIAECEIEVAGMDELRALERTPPARVMLDNFSPGAVREALAEIGRWSARPEVEISGGITLENIHEYALPGVDFISVGSLTNAAGALDLSLLVEETP